MTGLAAQVYTLCIMGAAVQVFTYNGQDWGEDNHATQGGYSDSYVIDSRWGAFVRAAP